MVFETEIYFPFELQNLRKNYSSDFFSVNLQFNLTKIEGEKNKNRGTHVFLWERGD